MNPTLKDINKLYRLKYVYHKAYVKVNKLEYYIRKMVYLDDKKGYNVRIAKACYFCRKTLELMRALTDFFDNRSEEKYTGRARIFIILLDKGCELLKDDVDHPIIEDSMLRSIKKVEYALYKCLISSLISIGNLVDDITLYHINRFCCKGKDCDCDWCKKTPYSSKYDEAIDTYETLGYPVFYCGKNIILK